jgi:dimethylargininase
MRIAVTRPVSAAMAECELTHLARVPIDVARAREQHEAYEQVLRRLGCEVVRLPAEDALADSVFVEDAAVVFDELAVITRPGAESRRAETASAEAALARYRPLSRVVSPGMLDGGDVLVIGKRVFIGHSQRTNREGIRQMAELLRPHGYEVTAVPVARCLHLKSAVTQIAEDALLLDPAWLDASDFSDYEVVTVHPDERGAANVLRVGDTLIAAAQHARTAEALRRRGLAVETLDVSEIAKAEGGLTCCSIVFPARGA